jgi:hypothetical protein
MIWKMVSEEDTFSHVAIISKEKLDVIANTLISKSQLELNNTFIYQAFYFIKKV